jgi:hypothetical protein
MRKTGERKEMNKKILVSIILLSMLAMIAIPPLTRSATAAPNLKFQVAPIRGEFVEEAKGEPLPAVPGYYLGYDIDMVNAEYFANGGEGIYVAIIDTGLVSNWASFLPPTANVRTDLGRGWSYNVVWNPGINDNAL